MACNPRAALFYNIVSVHSGKVLDVKDGKAHKERLIQWPLHNGKNQRFLFEEVQPNTFKIVAEHGGLVVTVDKGNGRTLRTDDYCFQDNQHWFLVHEGGNVYQIKSKHNGHSMDVCQGSHDKVVDIIAYPGHSGPNQKWIIQAA